MLLWTKKLKCILSIWQVFSQKNGNAVVLRQLGGFGQEFKSAFCAQLVCALEDPELNGEVQGLKMGMELLASTEIVNQINFV